MFFNYDDAFTHFSFILISIDDPFLGLFQGMANTTQKGTEFERRINNILVKAGYKVTYLLSLFLSSIFSKLNSYLCYRWWGLKTTSNQTQTKPHFIIIYP